MKVGDIIKGKDRSYARSLYRIEKINADGTAEVRFICLGGVLGRRDEETQERPLDTFQLATPEEIEHDLGLALKHTLLKIVKKLIRKSYPGQRSLAMLDHLQ